ncbi:unnamed protein product [Adineta ricciae]|uniref:G-protein coupled receptors family 1 profile domain-containing protein n=2 Tax=Adineta ricciae TaxID=249248 RepID=A0A815BQK3_ADIRI|nr:unnamed protein product [Adineta ricciae]
MISVEFLTYFRQTMAVLCCLFGLPGNLLTIIVCTKALYLRTMHLQRKMLNLYLVEISILEYKTEQKPPRNSTQRNGTLYDYKDICTIRSEYVDDQVTLLMNILVAGVLSLAVPALLVSIVNISMLCVIKKIYSTQTDVNNKRRSDITNYRSTRSTLLVISVTYALFYLPYIIFYFLMTLLEDNDGTLHYWSEITYSLRHVSHSVNFYAYICTSLSFRHECVLLVRSVFRPCLYFKTRRQYRQKKKRSQLIIIDKSPLPPPPLYSSFNRKAPRVTIAQEPEEINNKNETWM